ncbi:MAG: hypothetical protein VX589_00960, partial [Myxococcota bacterium]|nr:hypothetical protein [Myxococcota bacterium]
EAVYTILRHEAVHLRDMQRFPMLFHVSYLLLLPIGPSMRAWWEWRAYRETLQVQAELYGVISDADLERIAGRFTGPDYGFMWPFPAHIRKCLARVRHQILSDLTAAAATDPNEGRRT